MARRRGRRRGEPRVKAPRPPWPRASDSGHVIPAEAAGRTVAVIRDRPRACARACARGGRGAKPGPAAGAHIPPAAPVMRTATGTLRWRLPLNEWQAEAEVEAEAATGSVPPDTTLQYYYQYAAYK
jgi:hypothetical protein